MEARPLVMNSEQSSEITITVPIPPSPQFVLVNYLTDAASEPHSFANRIYVWQTTSNTVPWNKSYLADTPVPTDDSSGTVVVKFAYQELGYILGYAVGNSPQAVCSTVYLPQGLQNDPTKWLYSNASCSVVYRNSFVIQVNYSVLPNYLPATNKNWIGVWQGSSVPYQGDPLGWSYVLSDSQMGAVPIENLELTINTSYAVGYFFQDKPTGRTALGAQTTFTLGST